MTITFEYIDNKWNLRVKGYHDGEKVNQVSREESAMDYLIDNLDRADRIYIKGSDMKLYYDDFVIILKNYEEYKDNDLYKRIVKKANNKTNIVKILFANAEKLSKISNLTKKVVNVRTAVTTAVATSVVLGILAISKITSSAVEEPPVVITPEPIIIEQPSEYEEPETTTSVIEEETLSLNNEIYFDISDYLVLEDRVEELLNIQNSDLSGVFNIGTELNEYGRKKLVSFIQDNGQPYFDSASKYGIDPYLMLAISMAESSLSHKDTIPGGINYNGSGIGIMQIENTNIGKTVTAFNYETNEYESVEITSDNIKDYKSNVQIASMLLQNNLEKYNNNIYITIQAYNYGEYMMDLVIEAYAKEVGKTFEEVTLDTTDFGWMKYVEDVHNNPTKYDYDWPYSTYGNDHYIQKVLKNYMGENIVNNCRNNYYVYNLINNTCTLEEKTINSNNMSIN